MSARKNVVEPGQEPDEESYSTAISPNESIRGCQPPLVLFVEEHLDEGSVRYVPLGCRCPFPTARSQNPFTCVSSRPSSRCPQLVVAGLQPGP